jgi:hypothetical protein
MAKQTELEEFVSRAPWLRGDSLLKRAFAIWGYAFLAGVMVWAGLMLLFLVLGAF